MQIDKHYRIEDDTYGVVLVSEKPTGKVSEKTGKEIISKERRYYPNIKKALKAYTLSTLIDGIDKKDVGELLEQISKLDQKIDSL